MRIYSSKHTPVKEVHETPFKLERDIQTAFEQNLNLITGLIFVKSEFTLKNKRIDTLAFDEQSKAFVIIEYKRDKNFSVIDQGFTYLSLMLENQADFIMVYDRHFKKLSEKDDIDWSQSRVIFVSPAFTENQIGAANFKDLPIELMLIKQFSNDTFVVNSIGKTAQAESIKPIIKNDKQLQTITDQVVVYTEEAHLENASVEIKELYEVFKTSILVLDNDFELKPLKLYIAFKGAKNIVDICIQKKSLKIWLNAKWGTIEDGKNLARNVSAIGHHGNGDYEIIVTDDKEKEYILSLIKQIL